VEARRVAFVVVLEGDAARETGACRWNGRRGGMPIQFACSRVAGAARPRFR
jgi:hypothetical protein